MAAHQVPLGFGLSQAEPIEKLWLEWKKDLEMSTALDV